MIPSSPARLESAQWQRDLAAAISDPRELLATLGLSPDQVGGVDLGELDGFPLRVPRYFAALMRHGDPRDPLLAQVLPTTAEHLAAAGYTPDPVGDLSALRNHGVLQKYHGRALTVTTGACAVHCRYCFRRHFPYAHQSSLKHWHQTLETIRKLPDVDELILSGGDPLTLADRRLANLISEAEQIPRLRRLRIHTRLPVVLPNRVTPRLCDLLGQSRLQPVMVLHANHPHEVTDALARSIAALRAVGVTMLNQSVLLKSVNDDADTLVTLSETLFAAGALPYYLHLLDPVVGAAHFDVPTARARELLMALQARLPGYLVPRMVREVEGAASKTPI